MATEDTNKGIDGSNLTIEEATIEIKARHIEIKTTHSWTDHQEIDMKAAIAAATNKETEEIEVDTIIAKTHLKEVTGTTNVQTTDGEPLPKPFQWSQ